MGRATPSRRANVAEGGQAAVELALVLPLVFTLVLLVVQAALVVRDQVLVAHAAREGARVSAVDPDSRAVRRAVLTSTDLKADRVTVDIARGPVGGRSVVRVEYRSPTDLPIVGPLVPDIRIGAKAAMRVER